MPIYEFTCRTCDHHFETLVGSSGARDVSCPACNGKDLGKNFSVFAVSGGDSSSAAPMTGGCGSCGDPRGPGACRLPN